MLIAHTYTFFVPQQWKLLWELGCSIFHKVRVTLDLVEIWHKQFVFRSTRPEPCNHSITSLLVINCALPGIPHFEGYPLDANQEHSQEQGRRKLNYPRTLNKHSKLWFWNRWTPNYSFTVVLLAYSFCLPARTCLGSLVGSHKDSSWGASYQLCYVPLRIPNMVRPKI